MKRVIVVMFGVFGLIAPALAQAATVCGEVRYWDSRTPKVTASGSRLSGVDGNRYADRVRVYVYDRDGACVDFNTNCLENDDDYLSGYYTTNSTGYFCANVSPNPSDQPDVYLVSLFGNDVGDVKEADGTSALVASGVLAENVTTNLYNLDWNLTCNEDVLYTSNGIPLFTLNSTRGSVTARRMSTPTSPSRNRERTCLQRCGWWRPTSG